MGVAVDQAGHDQPQRRVDRLGALVSVAQIGRLADRDDAILADGDGAIGDDVPVVVEGEHNSVLDQDIDVLHRPLVCVTGLTASVI